MVGVLKPRVVVYFQQGRDAMAKDLAGRMRAMDNVEVTLVYSRNFQDEQNLYMVGAVVIQKGCDKDAYIAKMYEAMVPDAEIHYVDSEGDWLDAGEEATEKEPTVSTEAGDAPTSEVHGTDTPEEAGSIEAEGSIQPEDASEAGSNEEQAREA